MRQVAECTASASRSCGIRISNLIEFSNLLFLSARRRQNPIVKTLLIQLWSHQAVVVWQRPAVVAKQIQIRTDCRSLRRVTRSILPEGTSAVYSQHDPQCDANQRSSHGSASSCMLNSAQADCELDQNSSAKHAA